MCVALNFVLAVLCVCVFLFNLSPLRPISLHLLGVWLPQSHGGHTHNLGKGPTYKNQPQMNNAGVAGLEGVR